MQLIKLTTKQKELLEYKVKPLLTNDLSFNVELVNSILDIKYKKIDICTIVKYTKECLCNNKNPLFNNFHILNLKSTSFLYTFVEIITIDKKVDYYAYEKDPDGDYIIVLYKNNKVHFLEMTETYIFDDIIIRLACYHHKHFTNIGDFESFVLV